jgi:hypothetical protein
MWNMCHYYGNGRLDGGCTCVTSEISLWIFGCGWFVLDMFEYIDMLEVGI